MTIPEINVTVMRNEAGVIMVQSTHAIPEVAAIMLQFSRDKRRTIRTYDHLERNISRNEYHITFQEWSDAIARTISINERNRLPGVSSVESVPISYLTVGDMVYQLSPTKRIPASRKLAAARAAVIENAKVEAATIVLSAQQSVAALIEDARVKREEAKNVLAEAEANFTLAPPRWLMDNHSIIRYRDYVWQACFEIKFKIEGYDLQFPTADGLSSLSYSWDALPTEERTIPLWVPIHADGSYSVTSIRSGENLPHISPLGACMSPGDNPAALKSMYDFANLASSVSRCLRRVQLNSLYKHFTYWRDLFAATAPPDLRDAMERTGDYTGAITLARTALAATPTEQLGIEPENAELTTWTTV